MDDEYRQKHIDYAKTRVGDKNSNYGNHKLAGENNPNYGKPVNQGKPFTEAHKKKLSDVRKGKYAGDKNPMFGKPSANRGKHTSDEVRKKQSEAAKLSWTEERRKRQSGENNYMFGKTHTEEVRRKMSESMKKSWTEERRRQKSEEVKLNQSGENSPMWGKHHTEEARRKMSEAKRGLMAGAKNPRAKQVIRLSDDTIYACGKYAAEANNISYYVLKYKCKKHEEFMYYNEWLTLQNDYQQLEV
jgi:hypothetical protein